MGQQSLYEKNKEFMESKISGFSEKIEQATQSDAAVNVCEYQTRDGRLGLYIQNASGIIQLNSQYDSKIYAQIWADRVLQKENLGRHHIAVVFGFGNGDYVKALLDRLPEETHVVCYEPSVHIFSKVMHAVDLEEILSDKISIFVEGINMDNFSAYWQTVVYLGNAALIHAVRLPVYPGVFVDELHTLLKRIEENNLRIKALWNTQVLYAENVSKNQIKMLPWLFKTYNLKELLEKLPDNYPVIVIAAGPSLKKNIKELKRAKNRALLIAVDVSMHLLLEEGIVPDIYVTIDPGKPLELFEDERIHEVPLCTVTSGIEEAVRKQKKQVFFSLGGDYITDCYREFQKSVFFLETGGTVAHNAFTLAVEAKMNPIILVGQDLAFTDDQRHAQGAYKNPDKVEDLDDNQIVWVEDIYGNQIKTATNLDMYRKWYEETIASDKMKEIRVIDATEGGAKIEGTEIMTLHEAISQECTRTFDYEQLIAGVSPVFSEEEQERLREKCRLLPHVFRGIQELSLEGTELYEHLSAILKEEELNVEEVKECTNKLGELTEQIEGKLEYQLIEPYIKKVSVEALFNLDDEKDEKREDLQFVADKGLMLMKTVREGVDELMPDVEKMVREIENQQS